jgi:hypothetical protein
MAEAFSVPNDVVAPGTEGSGYVPLLSAGGTAPDEFEPAGITPTDVVTGPLKESSAGLCAHAETSKRAEIRKPKDVRRSASVVKIRTLSKTKGGRSKGTW